MKKISYILVLIIMGSLFVSCSQKLPLPGPEGAGMLVFPTTTMNYTSHPYGYYYTFLYNPETQVEIKIVPLGSRKFGIISGFPPGDYEITGITSISAPTGGSPEVGSQSLEFSKSVPFQIRSNEVTLLEYIFSVEQRLPDTNIASRYYQGYDFRPLNESQYAKAVNDLKSLQNAELWNLNLIPEKSPTDQDSGVVSSNQLYIYWNSWHRD